jgi:hypothetical protein
MKIVILQHPVALQRSEFARCYDAVCNFDCYSLFVFLYWYYMFLSLRPSSSVCDVVFKESAAQC